jgi:hypothetical protein
MRRVILPLLVCSGVCGQTFEVASIKTMPPQDGGPTFQRTMGGPGTKDPGRWTAEGVSLANLVSVACDLRPYQLSAADWLNNARFTVTAKVPEGAKKEDLKLMVRHPLAERFGLKGKYDFTISWSPSSARTSDDGETGPTIFAALQEQLGLKLEAKKGTIGVVVVDHIERTPTEN